MRPFCSLAMLKSALVALFFSLLSVFTPLRANEIFAREPLTIVRQDGSKAQFTVELALTVAQREQGLMYRSMLGENEGMLFDFGQTQLVTMWMKNTLLPLDMLFVDAKGTINHIHENAVPFSEAIISSVDPVLYVVEVNAGTVKRLGIKQGDQVNSAQMGTAD
nr:DUF192 domain-containing protein [uncultured Gellertiella sp.]